jgi:AcrR family transcriptional regulator
MSAGGKRSQTWRPVRGDASWERLRQAVIDLVLERGYHGFEIESALQRANFDAKQFDRMFDGKDDCCLRVYEANMADFDAPVLAAYDEGDCWRDGLRRAAYTAARYLNEHPREVIYGEIQMREGSEMAQAVRDSYLHRMVDLIDGGRQELDDPASLSRGAAEAVCGSIYAYLVRAARSGAGTDSLEDVVREMLYIGFRPYLGHAVACAERDTLPVDSVDQHG